MIDAADYFDPHELADRFAGVVGEATSDGGHVTVTVDAKGRVTTVQLDPRLSEVPIERLAEAIAAVCGKAFDNRIDQLADVVDQFQHEQGLSPDVLSFLHTHRWPVCGPRPALQMPRSAKSPATQVTSNSSMVDAPT